AARRGTSAVQGHQLRAIEQDTAREEKVGGSISVEVRHLDNGTVAVGKAPQLPERSGGRCDDVNQHAGRIAVFVRGRKIGEAVHVEIAGDNVPGAAARGVRDRRGKPARAVSPGDVDAHVARSPVGGDEIEPAVLVEVYGVYSARGAAGGKYPVITPRAAPHGAKQHQVIGGSRDAGNVQAAVLVEVAGGQDVQPRGRGHVRSLERGD